MDNNLTLEHRIVQPASDIHPVPGYDLVIFKQLGEGEGRKFRQVLKPNRKLDKRFYETLDSFLAFKVTRDRQKRYRFDRLVLMRDNTRSFTLNVTMSYAVKDPRVIVERLESDPLRRIKDEVCEVLAGLAASLSWADVLSWETIQADAKESTKDRVDKPTSILDQEISDSTGQVCTTLVLLQRFAEDLGLEILNLALGRTLPEHAIEVGIEDIRTENKLKLGDLGQKLTLQKERHLSEQHGYQRVRAGLDSVADSLIGMLTKASGQVENFSEMKQAMTDLQALKYQLTELTAPTAVIMPSTAGAPAVIGAPRAALGPGRSATGENSGELDALLKHLLYQLGSLDVEVRRPLLSAALHLLGEIILDGEDDDGRVTEHSKQLENHYKTMRRELSRDQIAVLRRLLDTETVREDLRRL